MDINNHKDSGSIILASILRWHVRLVQRKDRPCWLDEEGNPAGRQPPDSNVYGF